MLATENEPAIQRLTTARHAIYFVLGPPTHRSRPIHSSLSMCQRSTCSSLPSIYVASQCPPLPPSAPYFTMSQPASTSPPLSDVHSLLLRAKSASGLTFQQIGEVLGKDEVWVAAAFYGQARFSNEELKQLADVLKIEKTCGEGAPGLIYDALSAEWYPNRGLGPVPPTDPVIYRLYESVLVYGYPIKAIIHEKFGDGIMSMIDCNVNVEKKPDPKGDRVVLTFDGKFLPYSQW